jgi:hypothetical protein
MAAAKKPTGGAAKAAPPVPAPPAARAAHTLADASRIGLFGDEVDATPDSRYSATATAQPGGPGVIPAPKED